MLEVLVALAIASFVTVAVGGLFHLTTTATTTLSQRDRVQRALLQLQQILQKAGERLSSAVEGAGAEGLTLTSGTAAGSRPIAFFLSAPPLSRQVRFGNQENDVDLSMFDDVQLQYLILRDGLITWTDPGETELQIFGARLVLRLGLRTWRPLIWIAPPHDASSLTMPER